MKASTSIKSWSEYKNSPNRADSFRIVIEVLNKHGPMTGQEICQKANKEGLWKRLSELENAGLVVRHGKRPCSVTKKKAQVWLLKGLMKGLEPQ